MDKLSALIIEDDRDTAWFFKTVLDLGGFECENVFSAKDAFVKLSASVPDLILLDMRLGLEIGGADILYQIRSNPRFDKTRVIVITAYHKLAEPVTGLADLILYKPVEVDQLKTLASRLGTFDIKPKTFHFRDPVTELFNQEFFITRLELAFERTKRRPEFQFAALVIQFKLFDQGDDQLDPEVHIGLLREVASRLKVQLRAMDTLARSSGSKFLALLEDLKQPEDIKGIIYRLRAALSQLYRVDDETYSLRFIFGAAAYGPDFTGPQEILTAAEGALGWAIAAGHTGVYMVGSARTEVT
jgi:diguanylate cyclase (GGDEF)-like protein